MIINSSFSFRLNTNIAFGPRSIEKLIPFLQEKGFSKISIIIDCNVERTDYWQKFLPKLKKNFLLVNYFKNEMMEPTYDYLDVIRQEFQRKTDCFIGVGGGSTMDIAKAISVLLTNKKKALEYRGFDLIKRAGIPLVLIPTTAGSGSEVTPFAVFTDTKEKRKFGINSFAYLPILSIIDPIFTTFCPKSVTIASGMDALLHSIESFVTKKSNQISRFFSKEAFRLIFNNLSKAVTDPQNISFRNNLSLGAFFAGIALLNSSSGPAGVLSYPLGTLFKVPHGLAGAVFLYPIVKFNVENGFRGYDELSILIDPEIRKSFKENNRSILFLSCLKKICDDLNIPSFLNVFGVKKNDIPDIIHQVKLLWSAVEQNPVAIQDKDIEEIVKKMIND